MRHAATCIQRTVTHCNALQRTATHCNALQRTVTRCNALQRTCNTLHSKEVFRSLLCEVALHIHVYTNTHYSFDASCGARLVCCNTLQRTTLLVCCNTLQRTTLHCSTLQHTAIHCNTYTHPHCQCWRPTGMYVFICMCTCMYMHL